MIEDQNSPSVTMSLVELKGLMAETVKEAARAALKEDKEKLASQSQAASCTFGARGIIHKLQLTIGTNAGPRSSAGHKNKLSRQHAFACSYICTGVGIATQRAAMRRRRLDAYNQRQSRL